MPYFYHQKVENMIKKNKKFNPTTHPVYTMNEEIEERGLVIIDDVRGLPSTTEPYISPNLVLAICHEGYITGEYDMKPFEFKAHQFSAVYPNHPLFAKETSKDYRSTIIIIASHLYEELGPHLAYGNSFAYHRQPEFQLNEENYNCILHAVNLLKSVNDLDNPIRKEMIINLIDVLSKLLDHFRKVNTKDGIKQSLFSQFYELLSKHYKENREVSFYARMLCLSPKYFGSVIKRDIGISAGYCIAHYVVIQAKSLLHYRPELNIQQISQLLGFGDSTSFSRYFKAHEGISPKEYRDRILSVNQ